MRRSNYAIYFIATSFIFLCLRWKHRLFHVLATFLDYFTRITRLEQFLLHHWLIAYCIYESWEYISCVNIDLEKLIMCEEKGLIKVFWLWHENEFCTCKKWILLKNFIACNGDINGVTCNDNYYLLQLQFEPRLQYRVRNKN